MNFAGTMLLPTVFICDNNQCALPRRPRTSSTRVRTADRAAAYGFRAIVAHGTMRAAVYREARRAIEKAREGGRSMLIECLCLRMEGHPVHDDVFYVPKEMFEEGGRSATHRALPDAAPRETPRPHRRRGERDRVEISRSFELI